MNIAIYGRNFGSHFNGITIQLFEELRKNGVLLYINSAFYEFIKEKVFYTPDVAGVYGDTLPDNLNIDFMVSVGGDGTFLEAGTYVRQRDIPMLGINTGKLGFLAYVGTKNILAALRQLLGGEYSIEERMLLEVDTESENFSGNNFALNDFTIQKNNRSKMIKTKVFANGILINSYWSDGIIVSTPTGSTAYSLSCGGPIVAPDADVFIITPIATHNLTVRPLVVSGNSVIKIIVDTGERKTLATLDFRNYEVNDCKIFYIKKSKNKIKFVSLNENTYFSTLREKLMWGTDIRN